MIFFTLPNFKKSCLIVDIFQYTFTNLSKVIMIETIRVGKSFLNLYSWSKVFVTWLIKQNFHQIFFTSTLVRSLAFLSFFFSFFFLFFFLSLLFSLFSSHLKILKKVSQNETWKEFLAFKMHAISELYTPLNYSSKKVLSQVWISYSRFS